MLRFVLKRMKPSVTTLADRARDAGKWEAAIGHYRAALLRNPDNPPIWVQLGHALQESGHSPEAERAYRTAIGYDRRSADAHLQLGVLLQLQGKNEEARAAYLQAFAVDPLLEGAFLALAGLGWSEDHLSYLRGMLCSDASECRASDAKPIAAAPQPHKRPDAVESLRRR